MNLKTVELFAGIGGFRIAADKCGLETVWANDIDDNAVAVYKSNFGDGSIIQGDVNELIDTIPNHDILTGGFPCQPFSKAGKKLGVEDYRGTLFEAIVKILKRKNPSSFILENVNSLLYMDNGRNFQTILNALDKLDYKIEWCVLNAMDFGLPQHRLRVIIVGSKKLKQNESYFFYDFPNEIVNNNEYDEIATPFGWTEILKYKGKFKTWGMSYRGKCITKDYSIVTNNEPKKVKDILQKKDEVSNKFIFNEDTLKRIENSIYVNKYYNDVQILYNQAGGARMGYSIFGIEGVAPTLTASTSRHYERYKVGEDYRRLTNIEYARIQGFPDHYSDAITAYNQYKVYGNAVPPQIIEYVMKKVVEDDYCLLKPSIGTIFSHMEA